MKWLSGKQLPFKGRSTDKEVYQIVGAAGADAFANKVSNESPIGQALIGKKKGDTVTVPKTPAGS